MAAKTRPCAVCNALIDPERLEVVPETRLCTEHAREIQRFGGEFLRTATAERTSKPGSLKRNYSGVEIERSRNTTALAKLREEYERRDR